MNKQEGSDDGNFYKGLFFGVLLGVGLIWFLGTKEGEKLKKELGEKGDEFLDKAKESIDKALSEGFIEGEGFQEQNTDAPQSPPNQFFEEQT